MTLNPFANLWEQLGLSGDRGSRIFVSYRRDDARGDAGRLTDNLKARFGEKQIFRDIEAIEPGVDFVEAINRAVGASTVLLAVMGPNWLKIADERGNRRLDDPSDFIRLEVGAALKRNIRVVPVLVGDASMPRAEQLPPDLESFARRQAHELSDLRWEFDVAQLMNTIEKLGIKPLPQRRGKGGASWWSKYRLAGAAGVALLVIAVYIASEFTGDTQDLLNESMESVSPMPGTVTRIPPEPIVVPTLPARSPESFSPTRQAVEPRTPVRETPVRSQPTQPARPPLSDRGLDAIGAYPTVVQVFKPG